MIFGCPKCDADCPIPDDRVKNRILKVRCRRCQHVFYVKDPALEERTAKALQPAPPLPTDDEVWFYSSHQQVHGPVSLGTMRHLIVSAQVLSASLVWKEGMPQWTPLAQVSELAAILKETASPSAKDAPTAPGLEDLDLAEAEAKRDPFATMDVADEGEMAVDLDQDKDVAIARALMEEEERLQSERHIRESEFRRRREEEIEREAREETERQTQKEAERKAKEEAERQAEVEAERKAKEEAERLAKREAERKAKEEAERQAKAEAERKAKEEAERRAQKEAERKAKKEAEKQAKADSKRKAKEEAERRAKEEAERKAKEEAERQAKADAEKNAKAEAERQAKAEAEQKEKEESERQAKADAERKTKDEATAAKAAAAPGEPVVPPAKVEAVSVVKIARPGKKKVGVFLGVAVLAALIAAAFLFSGSFTSDGPLDRPPAEASASPAAAGVEDWFNAGRPATPSTAADPSTIPSTTSPDPAALQAQIETQVTAMRQALGASPEPEAGSNGKASDRRPASNGRATDAADAPDRAGEGDDAAAAEALAAIQGGSGDSSPAGNRADGLSQTQIKSVVDRNLSRIKFCYDSQLRRNPNLAGKMIISFTIVASGRVSAVNLRTVRLKGTEMESCIRQAILSWRFPAFSGDPITVDYPFIFSAF